MAAQRTVRTGGAGFPPLVQGGLALCSALAAARVTAWPRLSDPAKIGRMKKSPLGSDRRIAKMTFASVYPMYVAKVEKKGRTRGELDRVIGWLTGFDAERLRELVREQVSFEAFFDRASLNPEAHLITGVICGYRVEEIENPLTRRVRYLDKLVDELAKGRPLEKILRRPQNG